MSKGRLTSVAIVSILGLSVATLLGQGKPTAADLTLRPGDTITWTPAGPHKVQFGGTVTVNVGGQSTTITLTSPTDIEKVLTNFSPALPPKPASGPDVRIFPAATKVTATVRPDAAAQSVSGLTFTCGAHPNLMATVPFTFAAAAAGQPSRQAEIVSDPSFQWFLKTAAGNKTLNVNKQ
jgi:hypothetical protein